jgi:hypothetical protein
MGHPGGGDTLELTVNRGHDEPYDLGTGCNHLAIAVEDIHAALARLEPLGMAPEKPRRPDRHAAGPGRPRLRAGRSASAQGASAARRAGRAVLGRPERRARGPASPGLRLGSDLPPRGHRMDRVERGPVQASGLVEVLHRRRHVLALRRRR